MMKKFAKKCLQLSSFFCNFLSPVQVEFPPLAAYRLEFGEREPDPEEVGSEFTHGTSYSPNPTL